MKVLIALQGFLPEMSGGTERYVLATANELRARGHDPVLLAGTLEGRDQIELSESTYQGHRVLRIHRDDLFFENWDRSWHPDVSRLVLEILRRERPDVFHVNHWLRLSRDLVRQGRRANIPTILTLHDAWSTCPLTHRIDPSGSVCHASLGPSCASCIPSESCDPSLDVHESLRLYQADLDNEIRLAHRVFVLSRHQAQSISRVTKTPIDNHEVIPFRGVRTLKRAPVPESAEPLRVVNWGTQSWHKGPHVLLGAIRLMRHRDRIEVHLLGGCFDKAYDNRLDQLAEGLPVLRKGPFAYSQLETTPYHLAVFPSVCHETYGLALDEAQELGLPALITDTGAYQERIGPGGGVFPSEDCQALATILDQLIESPQRLLDWRAKVQRPRPFHEHIDFLLDTYESVIANPAHRPADDFDFLRHLNHDLSRNPTS